MTIQHTSNYDIINHDLALKNPIVNRVLQILKHPAYAEIDTYTKALEVMVIELVKGNDDLAQRLELHYRTVPLYGVFIEIEQDQS